MRIGFKKNKWATLLGLLAVGILGAVLSVPNIHHKSLWLDEAFSWEFSKDIAFLWHVIRSREVNMAFYYLLLHFWMRLFGESELAMRSLSVLFAVCTLPSIYWIGRRIWDEPTGLIAALLTAANPYFLFASQEARGFALAMFLAVNATVVLLMAQQDNRAFLWIAYSVLTALSVYAHYYSILMLAVHGVYVMTGAKLTHIRLFFFSCVLITFFLLPIIWLQYRIGLGQADWFIKPTLRDIVSLSRVLAGGMLGVAAASACLSAAVMAALIINRGKRLGRPTFRAWVLPGAWIVLPVLVSFLFSVYIKPVWSTRYFPFALPGYTL